MPDGNKCYSFTNVIPIFTFTIKFSYLSLPTPQNCGQRYAKWKKYFAGNTLELIWGKWAIFETLAAWGAGGWVFD